MFKKIIIILIVTNGLLALWFFKSFFADIFLKSEKIVVEIEQTQEVAIGEGGAEEVTLQTEKKVIATGDIKMAFKMGHEIIYYNRNNFLKTDSGGFYRETLSSYPFNNLVFAKCSGTGNFCLMRFNGKFSVYNLKLNQNFELEDAIRDVEFNSQGDGLIYLFFKDGSYWLSSSGLNGENWVQLKKIEGDDLDISISSQGGKLAYFSRKYDKKQSGIFLTNLASQDQAQRIIENDVVDILWSPSGERILFSYYDHSVMPKRIQLGYYDLEQKKQYNLGLPGLAQKCVWSDDSGFLYCAVLTSSFQKEFILEDWYSGGFVSKDLFWRMDLKSGQKERLFNDSEKYPAVDAFNLILFGEELIFVDKLSGNLISRKWQ